MPFPTLALNSGYEIPQIGFGTGTKFRGTDVGGIVSDALAAGFTHLDAAEVYRNEDTVGRVIASVDRSKIFVTSKFFLGDVAHNCANSVQKLGVGYLDLYLVHMPRSIASNFADGWKQFEALKRKGLARSIGVSNFTLEQLKTVVESAQIKPAVNQIRLHLYCYQEQKPILDYCAEHNILVQAYNVLTPITQDAGGPLDTPLRAAADARGCTPAQVIFLWLLAKHVVILTSSSKRERMDEYLATANFAPLTDIEIRQLEEAGEKGPSKNLDETMCSTCAGYNCTYCAKIASVSADAKANDAATRQVLATM
ncbi:Aldo/keto reductase [Auriculariales sp. MPI-PUGE-AT-0066]|nr:Aldo/keto reductase [Auriculariales sp. MPI-PUGE-AT-0066]